MKPLVALPAALAPALASACPACVRDAGPQAALFIAGMIGIPYLIGWLAVRAIRACEQTDAPGVEP
jgi:hypothetical protein